MTTVTRRPGTFTSAPRTGQLTETPENTIIFNALGLLWQMPTPPPIPTTNKARPQRILIVLMSNFIGLRSVSWSSGRQLSNGRQSWNALEFECGSQKATKCTENEYKIY
jgi:hypothetical protein